MKSHLAILLALIAHSCVVLVISNDELTSIYGMQRLLVNISNNDQLNLVLSHESDPGFDFMRLPRHEPFDLLVAADRVDAFKRELLENNVEFKVVTEDVSKVLYKSSFSSISHKERNVEGDDWPYAFPSYEKIVRVLAGLAIKYEDFITPLSLGNTTQGRSIVGLKFSRTCSCKSNKKKPALFIDAGIHAREWLAPSTALYAAEQLAMPEHRYLFEDVDIYVVPLLNPDGYEYSRQFNSTRRWRKTMSSVPGNKCWGVDANRNFDIAWNTARSSSNPCDDIYAGPEAFSEPETRALRDFLLQHRDTIKVYLTLHSFGNYLLYPWGYTNDSPRNYATLSCVAERAVAALTGLRGTQYTHGTSAQLLYAASGGSDDWAMGKAGIELAYTMELPSKRYKFEAPSTEIISVGVEFYDAIKVFLEYVRGEICQGLPVQEIEEPLQMMPKNDFDKIVFAD